MSRAHCNSVAAACVLIAMAAGNPAMAQHPAEAKGDTREVVTLSPSEAETMLAGMRTYLETIQGIVAVLAEHQVSRVPSIATQSGAKMLHGVNILTGLKLPLGFSSMSFDTHDRFDKLAEKAKRGVSRSEVLADLRDIMGNCVSCHAVYRLAR